MTVAAVVVAAGAGTRLAGAAGDTPKALARIGDRTLLELCLTGLRAVAAVTSIVVVHTPGHEAAFRAEVGNGVTLVPGGDTRSASVRAGVDAADPSAGRIAIHDAARCLVPPAVVARAIDAVTGDVVAAAPGLAVADTLKRVDDDGGVIATVDRDGLWSVHTPQVVRRDALAAALALGEEATDDLALVERAIARGAVEGRVRVVAGDPRDLKVTYPQDLAVAAAIVDGMRP